MQIKLPFLGASQNVTGSRYLHVANGARGYITKDEIFEDIVKTIRQVLKGQIYISSRLLKNLSKEDEAMSGFSVDGYVE